MQSAIVCLLNVNIIIQNRRFLIFKYEIVNVAACLIVSCNPVVPLLYRYYSIPLQLGVSWWSYLVQVILLRCETENETPSVHTQYKAAICIPSYCSDNQVNPHHTHSQTDKQTHPAVRALPVAAAWAERIGWVLLGQHWVRLLTARRGVTSRTESFLEACGETQLAG